MALTEARRTGEFILSEANGTRSREVVTIAAAAGAMASGTVVAKITASGKYAEYDNTASSTGEEVAAGILYTAVEDSGSDQTAVIIARDAEVAGGQLAWDAANDASAILAGKADLKALGIIVRE